MTVGFFCHFSAMMILRTFFFMVLSDFAAKHLYKAENV